MPKRHFHGSKVMGIVLGLLAAGLVLAALIGNWLSSSLISTFKPEIDRTVCGKWEIAHGPTHNLGSSNSQTSQLSDVAAVADDDMWTIGFTTHQASGHAQALIEHWDGKTWRIVPNPEPYGSVGTYLTDLVAISANDIWAVGSFFKEPGHSSQWTLTMHWDGTEWSIIPSPNVGLERNSLTSVTAVSSDDVWAVGSYEFEYPETDDRWGGWRIQVLHWDGNSWSIVPSPVYEVGPHADTFSNGLSDILAVS